MPFTYYVERAIAWFLFRLLTRWQVKGKRNVPRHGPLLVVANHLNNADPPLVAASLPCPIVFMAKEELFRSWGAWAVRGFGAFPVKKGELDREALRRAQQVLNRGLALGMFPEGTRSRQAQMQPAYPGVAFIAYHSGAPILPVGIYGTEKLKGGGWLLRWPRIAVNIGQPFTLPRPQGKFTREGLSAMTQSIMERVAELLPLAYRGVYEREARPAELAPVGGQVGN